MKRYAIRMLMAALGLFDPMRADPPKKPRAKRPRSAATDRSIGKVGPAIRELSKKPKVKEGLL